MALTSKKITIFPKAKLRGFAQLRSLTSEDRPNDLPRLAKRLGNQPTEKIVFLPDLA